MKLTVIDRLSIKGLVPQQTNMLKGMLFKSIDNKVTFSPEEITRFNLLDNNTILNNITETFEVVFEESELTVLRERIDELDQSGSIPFQAIDICCKIKGINV
jgi:hypothetical protein